MANRERINLAAILLGFTALLGCVASRAADIDYDARRAAPLRRCDEQLQHGRMDARRAIATSPCCALAIHSRAPKPPSHSATCAVPTTCSAPPWPPMTPQRCRACAGAACISPPASTPTR